VKPLPQFEYPEDVRFECSLCSRCCEDTEDHTRHVLLLNVDAKSIAKETGLDVSEFADQVEGSEPYVYEMKKPEDGKCFFLKNSRCTIYNIRPLICRFYPFQLDSQNNTYVFSYTNKCSGIGNGETLTREFFENLFATATKAMEKNKKE
jgi:Fe-S-cluster containining protein